MPWRPHCLRSSGPLFAPRRSQARACFSTSPTHPFTRPQAWHSAWPAHWRPRQAPGRLVRAHLSPCHPATPSIRRQHLHTCFYVPPRSCGAAAPCRCVKLLPFCAGAAQRLHPPLLPGRPLLITGPMHNPTPPSRLPVFLYDVQCVGRHWVFGQGVRLGASALARAWALGPRARIHPFPVQHISARGCSKRHLLRRKD